VDFYISFDRWHIVSFIVPFIFVNIVHIYRVSIRVRVRVRVRVRASVRVSVRLKVSIT